MYAPPPPGNRGGATYDQVRDSARLNKQATDVWMLMHDQLWRSLSDISYETGHPEASVSARLRDFRKERFGSHIVERMRISGGLWKYRLIPRVKQGEAA